jgi:hypothetical protein
MADSLSSRGALKPREGVANEIGRLSKSSRESRVDAGIVIEEVFWSFKAILREKIA